MDRKHIELAINNISNYGDTDIFPFPIENIIFRDKKNEFIELVLDFEKENHDNTKFNSTITKSPPQNIYCASLVGYNGFRWATSIEPFWNLYFLSLVLSIADELESKRLGTDVVHSYRYNPDYSSGALFEPNVGWKSFHEEAENIVKSGNYKFVLSCDISDFYNRIYHHKLENSLLHSSTNDIKVKKILSILGKISSGTSYGLPVGGQASRILAEQVLNRAVDKLMASNKIKFVRFVDDYYIFSDSVEQAHYHLNFLTEKLMNNEGLTLQKHKTQIISATEFLNLVKNRLKGEGDDTSSQERAKFMALPIRYDPYSPTADEDYAQIKENLKEFNIVSLLNEELHKSKIHQHFSKKLFRALDVASDNVASDAFLSIQKRFDILYPIFPTIMICASKNYDRLSDTAKDAIISSLLELFERKSHIIQTEINLAFALRVLSHCNNAITEEIIVETYKSRSSELIKSICMQIMIRWGKDYFISDLKSSFPQMQSWQRRMFIIGSYILKDEGKHWRDNNKSNFSNFEILIKNWAADNFQKRNWLLPI